MLVSDVHSKLNVQKQAVTFKNLQKTKDTQGYEAYNLSLPFDDHRYNGYVEIVRVVKNKDGEWHPDEKSQPKEIKLQYDKDRLTNRVSFDPSDMFLEDQSFAYRFKLVEKDHNGADKPETAVYHSDNGLKIGKEDKENVPYIIVHRNRIPGQAKGVMMHAVVDAFNNENWVKSHEQANVKTQRSHFNLMGGNLRGIIAKIPYLKEMGITRLLTTPIFGKDEISNHGYWTTNPYQIAERFGTRQDYKDFVKGLSRKGMTWVADGAFVNEGLEGVHMRYNLKWGEKSPYKHWIKGSGYKTLGILPDVDTKTQEGKELFSHFRIKIVNGDKSYRYTKGSMDISSATRDPKQRTFIQIYDERLASPEQIAKNEIIRKYDNPETDSHYDIATHNRSVLLLAVPVEEDELADFYDRMKANKEKYERGDQADFIMSVLKFKNFQVGMKGPGNFNTWDGNVDVAKLNYTYTNKDEMDLSMQAMSEQDKKAYKSATCQVQDFIQKTGSFWTRDYRNILVEDFARSFSDMKGEQTAENYQEHLKAQADILLPGTAQKMVSKEVIESVLSGDYYIPQLDATTVPRQRLSEDIMNYPLENIEFSDDLTAVLGSPMISKRAHTEKNIDKTRNEFFRANDYNDIPSEYSEFYYRVDDLYANQITGLASKAIEKADKDGNLGLFVKDQDKNNIIKLSPKGQLAFPLVSDDITKFLFVKALAPEVKVTNDKGELVYDMAALRKVNLRNINDGKGITAKTPEEEARQVFALLKKGMESMSENDLRVLSESIKDRLSNVSENGLKMAYVTADRAEIGLNWRTDATKDVVEIDNLRNHTDHTETEWEKNIKIWKGFERAVHKENPNAIIISEQTDMEDTELIGNGPKGRFKNYISAYAKHNEETGATAVSNYTWFFTSIQELYGRNAETGTSGGDSIINSLKENVTGQNHWGNVNPGLLYMTSSDGVKHVHNFVGNHDKPRIMHLMSLDMGIYNDNPDAAKDIEAAEKLYAPDAVPDKKNVKADRKALAMGKVVYENLVATIDNPENAGLIQDKDAKDKLFLATQDLVAGKFATKDPVTGNFRDKNFDPEIFGIVDPEVAIQDVILQAKNMRGLAIDAKASKELGDKTFELTTREGREKVLAIHRLLMVLNGDPTLYYGDEFAMGGNERACKNIDVKNRNATPWAKIDPESEQKQQFIIDFHNQMKEVMNIRHIEGLEALSTGDTRFLDTYYLDEKNNPQNQAKAMAMFRYNDDSQVIAIAHDLDVKRKTRKITDEKPSEGPEYRIDGPQHTLDHIALTSDNNGKVVAGLAGGLAVGTVFENALDKKDKSILGVCKEQVDKGVRYVLRGFKSQEDYETYLKASNKEEPSIKGLAKKIDLKKNVTVWKKVGRIPFGSRQNSNYIQIQAYLNSKKYLGQEPRYTSIKKA